MHFVLGIDAGATSTTAAVVDEMGTVRGVGHAGRANILIDGVEAGVNNICAAADSALLFAQARHEELSAVCIGAAGVGDEGDPIRDLLLREASQRLRLSCPIHIDHDAAVAHAGALSGKAGVIIIAGTGAIAFGRADDGRIARADGWGHWVGDEGGGFWMGMEALRIWMRAYDGRSHWTALAECIPRALNVDSPRELVVALSSGEISKDEIARLAFVIAEAAGNGDTIARQIIERAACKLAESAIAVARNLGFDCPTISYAGGIFRIGELILEPLHAELMTHLPSAHLTAPYMAPVMGAALLALRMLEDATLIKVDDEVIERLSETAKLWGFDALGLAPPDEEHTTLITVLPRLVSEQRNPRTMNLDRLTEEEILTLMNEEDHKVAPAVKREIPAIAEVVRMTVRALKHGGRIFYVGAGTSGRLGIIDAAECPPTFGTPHEWVQGIIAGGREAVFRSIEGAEDDEGAAIAELDRRNVSARDVVIGLSVSGRTPFVIAALREARARGAKTAAITANRDAPMTHYADVIIAPPVGPEVIAGSTRLKAGTAEKLILNMISTATMVKLGRVKDNLMISLRSWSEKLRERAKRLTALLAGVTESEAEEALKICNWEVRDAVDWLRTQRCDNDELSHSP